MNKKMIAGGVALMLLSIAIPASAYHITGQPATVAIGGATTSHDWAMDESLLTLCESDGPNDPVNDNPVATVGISGLCYMSPGSGGGVSDGKCPDGSNASPDAGTPSSWPCPKGTLSQFTWIFIDMTCNGEITGLLGTCPTDPRDMTWFAQSTEFGCQVGFDEHLVADEKYLFWQSNARQGHVTGFPDLQPLSPTGAPADGFGSYVAGSAAAPAGAPCDDDHIPVHVV